jgi:CRISP-associated protein Cas1
MTRKIFAKVTRENLPQVKDRYPFLYLEHGRLEIDDSSVKWIDSDRNVVRIPCATIHALLLGPGVSITHEAVKTLAASNCTVCWVGEDSLLFYALGQTPNADTRNFRRQMLLAVDERKCESVARRMFARRFPEANLNHKTIAEMRGMEGYRVRSLYDELAQKYGVGWKGRSYVPGKFEVSDITNQYLTAANAALYGLVSAAIHSMGYSPHIGFIHTGCPLPFVYDIADLYKEHLCIDLAFSLTLKNAGKYDRHLISDEFRSRILAVDLLGRLGADIEAMFKGL